jgi:hypothetical protein
MMFKLTEPSSRDAGTTTVPYEDDHRQGWLRHLAFSPTVFFSGDKVEGDVRTMQCPSSLHWQHAAALL